MSDQIFKRKISHLQKNLFFLFSRLSAIVIFFLGWFLGFLPPFELFKRQKINSRGKKEFCIRGEGGGKSLRWCSLTPSKVNFNLFFLSLCVFRTLITKLSHVISEDEDMDRIFKLPSTTFIGGAKEKSLSLREILKRLENAYCRFGNCYYYHHHHRDCFD